MTYVPAQQSTFDETDSDEQEQEFEETEDQGKDSDKDFVYTVDADTTADESTGDDAPQPSEWYSLRTRKDINYTMRAVPIGLMNDTLTVKTALRSPKKDRWLTAINEEFESLQEANTFETYNFPESGDMVLPAGIILKLKREQHGRPARFQRRLIARGNFQPNGLSYVELYVLFAYIELLRVFWPLHQL